MAITAKELAKKLNVSPSTISIVFNNGSGVSEKRRKEILEAAQKLGYEHTPRMQRTTEKRGNIGLLMYQTSGKVVHDSFFYSSFIDQISSLVSAENCNLLFLQCNDEDPSLEDTVRNFAATCIALIVIAIELPTSKIPLFEKLNLPVVLVGNYRTGSTLDSVFVNNGRGIHLAVSHLKDCGHTRIGFIDCTPSFNTFTNRYHCFERAMNKAGLSALEEDHFLLEYGKNKSFDSMCRLIQSMPSLPSAFIAANDVLAVGAIQAILQCGYRVPEDIAIIGFDDQPIASLNHPQLTTIRVSVEAYAQSTLFLLFSRLEKGRYYPASTIATGVELVVRESTVKADT